MRTGMLSSYRRLDSKDDSMRDRLAQATALGMRSQHREQEDAISACEHARHQGQLLEASISRANLRLTSRTCACALPHEDHDERALLFSAAVPVATPVSPVLARSHGARATDHNDKRDAGPSDYAGMSTVDIRVRRTFCESRVATRMPAIVCD